MVVYMCSSLIQLAPGSRDLSQIQKRITNALSFYRSKMILDRPNCFGMVQIVLVESKSFWLGLRSREYRFTHMNCSTVDITFLSKKLFQGREFE